MLLCCGEALIDMIPATTRDGAAGFAPHCGGAVFNTAIALGRLGAPVGLLTGLSRDMFGQQLAAGLNASHVDLRYVIPSDRPTTLAFVRLSSGQATYDFYDENSAGRMISFADMPSLGPEVTALFFGGISLACEPGADAYAALLKHNGAGRAVMLDPNIRPGFIRDRDRYGARLERMIAQSDIIKVSDEDLDWIIPDDAPQPEKIKQVMNLGPSLVILTRGSEGAMGVVQDGTAVHVPARKADIVDTVGAGDTFNAGVLAKLSALGLLTKPGIATLTADTLEEILMHGAAAAAVTVSRAGANPPWAKEL